MITTRRTALRLGGGLLAVLACPTALQAAGNVAEITMNGRGEDVWFDPVGIHVAPGTTIRWINRDRRHIHTTTSYHPRNLNRPQRMPSAAKPWNSGDLAYEQGFSVTLTVPGVYDYFCTPHEARGMVGRIVVGEPGPPERLARANRTPLPPAAREGFPKVGEIMDSGFVSTY